MIWESSPVPYNRRGLTLTGVHVGCPRNVNIAPGWIGLDCGHDLRQGTYVIHFIQAGHCSQRLFFAGLITCLGRATQVYKLLPAD